MTQDECAQIEAGTLPRDHAIIAALSTPGKLFVLHANALMQRNDAPALAFADSLARLTQALHPEARIVMDPLDGGTASRLAALSAFDRGATARLDAVLPDRAHGVLDGKLLQNLTSELVQEGATVATYARAKEAAAALGPNLLVIAGHSSAELASFVGDLGHHDVFRGRIVLFDACATPLTRQLAREIVTRYGANAVFVYEGVIGVNALEPATLDLVRDLGPRSTVTGGMLKRIRDALWKRRLRAVPHVLLGAHPGAAPA